MYHETEKKLQLILLGLTKSELREASHMVREHFDLLQRQETRAFRLGDNVSFVSSKLGRKMSGTVVKINLKTIAVRVADGKKWLVSAGMLEKEETAKNAA